VALTTHPHLTLCHSTVGAVSLPSVCECLLCNGTPVSTYLLKKEAMRNLRCGFFKETKYPFYRRLYGPQGLSGRMRKSTVPSGFDLPNAQASSESLCRLRHPGPSINSKVIILHLDIPSVFLLKTWNYRYFLPLENFCVGLRISACNDYNGVSFLKFVLFIYLFIVNY